MELKEFQDACDEARAEIIMRKNMLDKSTEEKKKRYWENRIKSMRNLLKVLIELGATQGFAPKGD